MPYESVEIVIHRAWALYPGAGCSSPPSTPVRAKASFDSSCEQGFVSKAFARKLLSKQQQQTQRSSGVQPRERDARRIILCWTSSTVDKTIATSPVTIVTRLHVDVVLPRGALRISHPLDNRTMNTRSCTSASANRENRMNELNSTSRAGKQLAVHSCTGQPECDMVSRLFEKESNSSVKEQDVMELGSAHGIYFANAQSLWDFYSYVRRTHSAPTAPSTSQEPTHQLAATIQSDSQDSASGSEASQWSWPKSERSQAGSESTTAASNESLLKSPPGLWQLPISPWTSGLMAGESQGSLSEYISEDISDRGTPTSDQPLDEDFAGSKQHQNTQDMSASQLESVQQEFENHPGHKVWEWDVERQQWRKRGTTDEWFPTEFA